MDESSAKGILETVKALSYKQMEQMKPVIVLALGAEALLPTITEHFGSPEGAYASLLSSKKKPRGVSEARPSRLVPSITEYVENYIDLILEEYAERENDPSAVRGALQASSGCQVIKELDVPVEIQGENRQSFTVNFRLFIRPTLWKKPKKKVADKVEIDPAETGPTIA